MPQVKVAQELFAGLFTEATPEGLPQGASPRAINVDYIVGSVGPRPGKQSKFTFPDFFFESAAGFTRSIGTGAVWTSGTTILNNPSIPGGTPVVHGINSSGVAGGGFSLTIGDFAVASLAGPAVVLLPWVAFSTRAIVSMVDNAGGVWSELVAPISFLWGSQNYTYQLWGAVFPSGVSVAEFLATLTVNYDVDLFGGPQYATFNGFEHCSGIDTVQSLLSATGLSSFTGPTTVTSANRVIVAMATDNTSVLSIPWVPPTGSIKWSFQFQSLAQAAAPVVCIYGTDSSHIVSAPGTYTPNFVQLVAPADRPQYQAVLVNVTLIPDTGGGPATGPISQTLQALNFNLEIPTDIPEQGEVAAGCGDTFHFVIPPTNLPVTGIEVRLTGSQSSLSPDAEVTVRLHFPDGTLSPEIKTVQMPLTTGTVTVGSPTDLWGFTADQINAIILDDPNFTVDIVAVAPGGETVTFTVSAEVLVAFTVPNPPPDVNYLKSFLQTDGGLNSLVLGSNGVMYIEDAINDPFVLNPLFSNIFLNSYAQSATLDDREYIAISDLEHGTDLPRVYTPASGNQPATFDRLSQEGPGAEPSATGSNVGGVINITSITQPSVKSDPEAPGHISGFLWSAGPGSTEPGNVLTVYWGRSSPPGPSTTNDPDLVVGAGVTISGADNPADTSNPNNTFNGQTIDGNYTVTSVGEGVPPGAQYGRWYFTVQMTVSQFVNQADHIMANYPDGFYQVTTATLTAASPIPNMQIGSTMQIAGTGGSPPAGYDGSWTVTATNNAAQLEITNTSLTANVAHYSYILISGVAPSVGSRVTIGNTLNGDGIFNVSNATITSASPGSFDISLVSPDISGAAENGTGIVAGTIFKFEPGQPVGTRFGGTVVVSGNFAFGKRKVCYSFLTRNGFVTRPSPIHTTDIVIGSTGIAVSHLAVGPENVVARIIHFTGANGGQLYNIPDPVIVTDPVTGQDIVNDSTWVMDNTTTNVVLSFSDEVLFGGIEIDIQGNNLFACYELGACTMLVPYPGAQRLAALGEQNKVFLFRNHSFDGGVGGGGLSQSYPLGWTVDVASGAGGSVVDSPIFGWAYQIANSTGGPQAIYGMITQPAYKDEFQADIIEINTTYSVRVTAMVTAAVASGNLVIDLYSASQGGTLGSFTLPLNTLTTRMELFSGSLLTNVLSPVPQDLLLRIYATNIPDGATVILDREEVFPTRAPNNDTQVIFSYAQNFESFDRITGVIKPSQNSQPIKSAFVEFDTFYMGKIGSMFATNDNGTTEPVVADAGWVVKTISLSVGAAGVYGITAATDEPNIGEDWAIVAGQAGAYIYDGGEPVKLSEEIQSIWNRINWDQGAKNWVLNDITNRRILFGVCLKTFWFDPYGNVMRGTWLPEGVIPDDPTPTTPNVVLELNYKQLNTAGALASSVGVHRSYSGKLLASEMTRKWALWTIKAPAAAFLRRADKSAPIFFGNSDGNGKIFELVEGLLEDDGSPFSERYVTSPFLPREMAQGAQLGVLRYGFTVMTLIIDGQGTFRIQVHPNYVDGAGNHALLPDLTFPVATWGDAEVPVDEEGNRMFVEFIAQCVNSAWILSGMTMSMSTSGFAPYAGRNR